MHQQLSRSPPCPPLIAMSSNLVGSLESVDRSLPRHSSHGARRSRAGSRTSSLDHRLSIIDEDGNPPPPPPVQQPHHRPFSRRFLGEPPRYRDGKEPPRYSMWDVTGPKGEKFEDLRNNAYVAQRGGWKRICLIAFVVTACIVALAVGLAVGLRKKHSGYVQRQVLHTTQYANNPTSQLHPSPLTLPISFTNRRSLPRRFLHPRNIPRHHNHKLHLQPPKLEMRTIRNLLRLPHRLHGNLQLDNHPSHHLGPKPQLHNLLHRQPLRHQLRQRAPQTPRRRHRRRTLHLHHHGPKGRLPLLQREMLLQRNPIHRKHVHQEAQIIPPRQHRFSIRRSTRIHKW